VRGLKRTRERTVIELLPRPPPAVYSDAELTETERRLNNLGIFDQVRVVREPSGVLIEVREKWTLIPLLDLARGKTFKDTYLLFGAIEYNFVGTATTLGSVVFHEERGWNGEVFFGQHGFHPERGAVFGELEWKNASYRFEDSDIEWHTRRIGGEFGWSPPLSHGKFFNYQLGSAYHYELVDGVDALYRPPSGHNLQAGLDLIWSHYRWTDLNPRGYFIELFGAVGALAGPDVIQERLFLEGDSWFAAPLARYTTFMGRWKGQISSIGNANFTNLLGGLEGVRGLDDALYRNWAQSYLNLELRQSIPLFKRLAAQLVAFSDGAVFQQLDPYGRRAEAGTALSAGLGGRLIPTFLKQVLLRADVARLLIPRREWFVQWGLSQYF
jgi:hypothetical protein